MTIHFHIVTCSCPMLGSRSWPTPCRACAASRSPGCSDSCSRSSPRGRPATERDRRAPREPAAELRHYITEQVLVLKWDEALRQKSPTNLQSICAVNAGLQFVLWGLCLLFNSLQLNMKQFLLLQILLDTQRQTTDLIFRIKTQGNSSSLINIC